MKIFADLHHGGLYASFHYLFERRLEAELYRPVGMDWFEQGYWKIAEPYNNALPTVKQYLDIGYIPTDGTNVLNSLEHFYQNETYYLWDKANQFHHKGITLEKFKKMNFDYVIASIPQHIAAYAKLIADTGSKAKLIYHIGNIGWHESVPWNQVRNLMASVKEFKIPEGKNAVFYRQEFDLGLFQPTDSIPNKDIVSFVNCMPKPEYFAQLERNLPEYNFKSFGISCRDGICQSSSEIANIMRNASWGYHLKPFGDGFGHVIHNWAAVGKPLLVGMRDYNDKLAGELLEDTVTCIDISSRNPEQVAGIVREMTDADYARMVSNMRARFDSVVDFEKDAENVRNFLEKSLPQM